MELNKKQIMKSMVENKFSIADIIFVLDTIGEKVVTSSNLSMKQVSLLPVIKSLSLSGSFVMNEESFNAALGALIVHAASRDISQADIITSLMYSLLELMHVVTLLSSDSFYEVKKEIGDKITVESMTEWLESKLEILEVTSKEDLSEKIHDIMNDCDGDCDNCDANNSGYDIHTLVNKKLH